MLPLTNPAIARWLILVLLASAPATLAGQQPSARATVNIGVLRDGPWDIVDQLLVDLAAELDVLVADEFDLRFDPSKTIDGQWQLESIQEGFEILLGDPEVDLVLTMGLVSSQLALTKSEGFEKPVVAPLALEYALGELPRDAAGSGIRNLSYVALPQTLRSELDELSSVVQFRDIGILANREVLEALPGLEVLNRRQLDGSPFRPQFVGISRNGDDALSQIPQDLDAVYVLPLLMERAEMQKLIDGLNARRLPSFSSIGPDEVRRGMLATVRQSAQDQLARRTALNVQRILLGEAPQSIPILLSSRHRMVVNMQTAREIGANLRWSVLLEADLLNQEPEGLVDLDILAAARLAVESNLDLLAERIGLDASAEEIRRARATLLPQIDAQLQETVIDAERARASFGTNPERASKATMTVQQLIYSDAAQANVRAQQLFQETREVALEQTRLEVAVAASVAFLDLLRAKNLLIVRRENLGLTRSNLELADARREVGSASAGEIYRWQSQLATDRQQLIDAQSNVRAAEIALNRILHRPLETRFQTVEVSLEDQGMVPASDRFQGYIATPYHFELTRQFAVEQGLDAALELRQFDTSIAARERLLTSLRRALWLPTISAQGQIDERLAESGAGSDLANGVESTSWSLGVVAALPLFTGGDRRAEIRQAELDLEQLRIEKAATKERVEEAVRSAMIVTRSAFERAGFAKEAAETAQKNLELVQDAYARGAVDILELLDAQNAALQAETGATDTTYDFFVNLMQLQRATSSFDFFVDERSRTQWFLELEDYFERSGATPWTDQ